MPNKTLAGACFGCTVCKPEPKRKGALLTWGQSSSNAKVLVLSGPIVFSDSDALDAAHLGFGRNQFEKSTYGHLANGCFGGGWFDNPRYIVSGSIRCDRGTVGYDEKTLLACSVYTRQLMRNVSGVLALGGLAKLQLLNILGIDELMYGSIVRISNWVVAALDEEAPPGFADEFNRKVDES